MIFKLKFNTAATVHYSYTFNDIFLILINILTYPCIQKLIDVYNNIIKKKKLKKT